jgi:ABC-type dipeptide/oligopeptide/nickel transport system ATPase component
MLNELIEEFKDRIDPNDFYSYVNFEIVKEELISTNSNIVFLLGEPGSGKSFMLSYIKNLYPDKYILQTEPFLSKEEFLNNKTLEGKTILIDEAQLLSMEMIEFLRILSDKGNRIVFSMHEKEGLKIANLPQFNSRYTKKIFMKPLSFDEFEKYVLTKFIRHNKKDLISKKALKRIFKYTKGNFRLSKKFIFTALNLLNYSLKNSLKYKKIDSCIIEMSAIELGLVK